MEKSTFIPIEDFLAKDDCPKLLNLKSTTDFRYYIETLKKNVDINTPHSQREFEAFSQKILKPYMASLHARYKDKSRLAKYCSFSQFLASQTSCQNLFIGWASAPNFKKILPLTRMRGDFCIGQGHSIYENMIKDSVVFNAWDNFSFLLSIEPVEGMVKNYFLDSKFLSTSPGILTAPLFEKLIEIKLLSQKEQDMFRVMSKRYSPQHYIAIERIYLSQQFAPTPIASVNKKSIKV